MKLALHMEARSIRGAEIQILHIARGFIARGHTVIASCRVEGPVREELEKLGVRTTGIRPRGDIDVVSALQFAGWLRRERPDALLLTSWKRQVMAGWAAHVAGVPRVALRRGEMHRVPDGARGALRRHAFRAWYDVIIANCERVRADVLADVPGYPATAIPVIASAVIPEDAPPTEIRRELRLPPDARILLAVGGVEPRKGLDLLAGALTRLEPSVHAVVAGGGREEDEARLRKATSALGVAGRVHLLGHRRDVRGLLAAADVFVQPSRRDSLPIAMLEAMAAGLPVVSTDVGGVEEALLPRHGRGPGGWVVPREDSDALAEALRQALAARDGPTAPDRGAEACWRATHWFSVDRMVEEYIAALT